MSVVTLYSIDPGECFFVKSLQIIIDYATVC